MLVSVIIPAYKMGCYIGQALSSVDSQTHLAWEVLVVDDCGPDDGTAEIVAEFARQKPGHRVEFFRHQQNGGVSKARNTALAASKGEVLAFLDPDDAWLPSYLSQMLEGLSDADICVSQAIRISADGQNLGTYQYGPNAQRVADFPLSLAKANFFNPSFTVVRRVVYEQLGGYDEAPEIQHAEDWDYWLRAVQAGFRFNFRNEELCLYREHAGAATANHLRISSVCSECLRRNLPRHQGELSRELKASLYRELLVQAHVRKFYGMSTWAEPLIEAIKLSPFRSGAWKRALRLWFK